MKIKKGDRVRVLTGKDRGKEGEVMRAIPAEPGWLTIFPSHIFHDVAPTGASEPRISVISDLIPLA